MRLSEQIKLLAKGINPETGELLDDSSVANSPNAIRLLFSLAEEIAHGEDFDRKSTKLSSEEKREQNIASGKPPRSHFRWDEEERQRLAESFDSGMTVENIAIEFERSILAIAVQLERLSLITEEEFEGYRFKK